jgi:hypothetical protein
MLDILGLRLTMAHNIPNTMNKVPEMTNGVTMAIIIVMIQLRRIAIESPFSVMISAK